MSCRELVEKLIEYLDGDLTAEEAQRIRAIWASARRANAMCGPMS